MASEKEPTGAVLFSTQLGWMGIVWSARAVQRLTFGHPHGESAARTLAAALAAQALGDVEIQFDEAIGHSRLASWQTELIRRLQAYAAGQVVDFTDVPIDLGPTGPFQGRVYALCRRIPYGGILTYGELARRAGSPQASRAVGQCLARNPIPLVIPCHRVVGSRGHLGGFTAPGGLAMKKRLLQLEAAAGQTAPSCR